MRFVNLSYVEVNMNTKLILAIAIVALVGVVAATYQINNTNDLTNSYTDVEPVQVEAQAADSADPVIGADSANSVSSNNIQTAKKSSTKTKAKQKNKVFSNSRGASSGSSSGASSSGSSSSGTSGQNAGSQATIDAYSVARSAGIQLGATSTRFITSYTANGAVYNLYGQYKNGQCIAETEVNTQTGQITGGAWIGEVNPGSSSTDTNTPSSTDSGSGASSSSSDNTENANSTSE